MHKHLWACLALTQEGLKFLLDFLPTAREGNIFTGICQSVSLFTFCIMATQSLLIFLQSGRYTSCWNAFLFI